MIRLRSMRYVGFIFSGSPNGCWLKTYHACVKATWKLGLRASQVARISIHLVVRKAIWPYATYRGRQSALQDEQNEVYVNGIQPYLDGVLPLVFEAEGLVRGLGIARSRIHVMQQ